MTAFAPKPFTDYDCRSQAEKDYERVERTREYYSPYYDRGTED